MTKGEKNGMWGKKGENAINGRMVVAYTDEQCTNLFKIFPSVREACKFLETKGHSSLNAACRENLKREDSGEIPLSVVLPPF